MFAIIRTGGKQYRVAQGETLRVEKLALEPGATLEFSSLLVGGENPKSGKDAAGVKVAAEVLRHVKGDKIFIDKYKSGIQYRRRNGHRQQYTEIRITGIQ
jgi:large subunit ribosomal protein L21